MADLAMLAFGIDSSGLEKGTTGLEKLTASAVKTEKAVDSLGAASEKNGTRIAGMSKATERTLAALERMEAIMRQQSQMFTAMNASLAGIAGQSAATVRSIENLTNAVEKLKVVGGAGGGGRGSGGRGPLAPLNDNLPEVGEKARLTGNQLLNLSRQGNDAITMLASGSSVTQVFATQLGQVIGALEEGPGGLRGSLTAIKDAVVGFALGLGPAGIALGALATSAVAFGLAIRKDVEPVDDIIKRQTASVRELREAYGLAASASEDYGKRASKALAFDAQQAYDKDLKGLRGRVSDFESDFFSGRDNYSRRENAAYEPIRRAFLELRKSAADGIPDFVRFRNVLAEIAATDPTSSFFDGYYVRDLAKDMLKASEDGAKLQVSLEGVKTVTDEAAMAAKRMEVAYGSAMKGLQGLIPDLRTDAERINDFFDKASANAKNAAEQMAAGMARAKAMQPITDQAQGILDQERSARAVIGLGEEARAVAEVNSRYDALAKQYAGNADALVRLEQARAQAIDNAGTQAAFDRQQDQAKEQEAAAKRATAEAERYAQATRSRISGLDQSVAAQRMELELLGQSEGATAALRFEFQALSAAKQAAAAAGTVVSDEEIAAIQLAAGEIGQLTEQYQAMRDAQEQARRLAETFDELAFERSIMGLSDAEQRVRETIRSVGVDYASMDGQRLAGELRYNDALRDTQDEMRRTGEIAEDAFGGLIDALTQGGDLMQNLMGFAADLGRQFASMGAQKLFGNLFGGGQAANDNFAGIGSAISGVVSSSGGSFASAGGYAGGNVASAPMRALNDNLSQVSRSALDVAKQFNGLNERADSRVLDSFLRTSGNWKNLSAADTAWCAAFANAAIIQSGGQGTGSNLASSFMGWGQGTNAPKVGDIVVLKPQARGASGHVGFVAGFGDGTVQVFGGNQSNGANTRSFGLDQVRGYRTSGATTSATQVYTDQRIVARGVSEGMKDFTRQWGGTPSPSAQAAMANGSFDGFSHNGAAGGRGLFSQNALGVLGAGVGAFGAGYQSGSPFSGGLSGALGGYQAGGAISGMLGIGAGAGAALGVVGGAALGILGGILGARKQREQVHRQKAEAWEQMRPQYEAFDQSLSGEGQGQFRQWITTQRAQLDQFMKVGGDAWKYGTGNSTAQFASTGTKMYARFQEMLEEFQEGFTDMLEDLSSGEGLGGAFAKGRAATKDLKKQIEGMIDDVSIAFGSADIGVAVNGDYEAAAKEWEETRNRAIEMAKKAAGEYSLSLLYTAKTTSDVEQSLDGFRGTAAGLQSILEKLGWTAEDAAADIKDRLNQAIAEMGKTFTDGFQREINDLSGTGYLNDIADLIKARDTGLSDAALLGVDPSIVTKWFSLALQDVVSNADLAADALEELKRKFPELASVSLGVTAKMQATYEKALQERADAEAALRTEYERTVDRIAGIKDFLSDMALDDNLSTLSGKEQFDEAQRLYRETLFKANGGDQDAQDKLLGVTQDYLDEAKAYYATSEKYGEVYREIESTLKASATRMETELDVARKQASFLEEIAGGTKGLSALLEKYLEADRAVGGSLSEIDANRQWGIRPVANRKNVAEFRAAGLPEYMGNFGPDTWPQIEAWLNTLSLSQRAQAMAIMTANNAIGYASGGYTGMGGVNEVAGMVHRGEVVWNQDDVRAWGGPARVDAMRVARMPEMPMMQAARNDNRDLVAAVGRLEALMRTQVSTTGSGLLRVAVATEEGTRSSRQAELAARRAANNKQAA